jgi:hypothetical protein
VTAFSPGIRRFFAAARAVLVVKGRRPDVSGFRFMVPFFIRLSFRLRDKACLLGLGVGLWLS